MTDLAEKVPKKSKISARAHANVPRSFTSFPHSPPCSRLQIQQKIPKPRIRLHTTRQDLIRRQNEPIIPRIPQFRRKRILRLTDIGHVVDAAAGDLVDGGADGPGFEDGAVDGLDGCDDALGEGLVLSVVGGYDCAGVAVCWSGERKG